MFRRWFSHPLTRGLDIDSPGTTALRRQIVLEKSFLHKIYCEWYETIVEGLPAEPGSVLELGAGAGFLADFIPALITSDLFPCPNVRAVLDGAALPFAKGSLRAIVMTDVLHHLSQPRRFFREASRCVRPGGALVMIEPWVSAWSRWVYQQLHPEPFLPESPEWEFPSKGPLSGANGALPWILFARDRRQFELEFPEWRIQEIHPGMPFCYLLSGGISLRSFLPGWAFKPIRKLELGLEPWIGYWAMFATLRLVRLEAPAKTDSNA